MTEQEFEQGRLKTIMAIVFSDLGDDNGNLSPSAIAQIEAVETMTIDDVPPGGDESEEEEEPDEPDQNAWERRGFDRDGKRSIWYDPDTKRSRVQLTMPGSGRKKADSHPAQPPPVRDEGSTKLHPSVGAPDELAAFVMEVLAYRRANFPADRIPRIKGKWLRLDLKKQEAARSIFATVITQIEEIRDLFASLEEEESEQHAWEKVRPASDGNGFVWKDSQTGEQRTQIIEPGTRDRAETQRPRGQMSPEEAAHRARARAARRVREVVTPERVAELKADPLVQAIQKAAAPKGFAKPNIEGSVTDEPAVPILGEVIVRGAGGKGGLKDLFGDNQPDMDLLSGACNATDGSKVEIQGSSEFDKGIEVSTFGPGFAAGRTLYRDENDALVVRNDSFFIDESSPMSGSGAGIFLNQVRSLRALGVTKIVTGACGSFRSATGGGMNGYITWPKFGYDGDMTFARVNTFPKEYIDALNGKANVQSLLALPGGEAVWELYGSSFDAEFDLSDNSPSMRKLQSYIETRRASAPKGRPARGSVQVHTARKADLEEKINAGIQQLRQAAGNPGA